MKPEESNGRRGSAVPAVFVLLAGWMLLSASVLLAAGYAGAWGRADALGNPVGFNDPLTLGHLPVMAGALSLRGVLRELNPLVVVPLLATLAAMAMAFGTGIASFFVRASVRQNVAFLVLGAGSLLQDVVDGHRWTGECVNEGELSSGMAVLLWCLAWISALAWPLIWKSLGRLGLIRGFK